MRDGEFLQCQDKYLRDGRFNPDWVFPCDNTWTAALLPDGQCGVFTGSNCATAYGGGTCPGIGDEPLYCVTIGENSPWGETEPPPATR